MSQQPHDSKPDLGWHRRSTQAIAEALNTDLRHGLSRAAATTLLERHGANQLRAAPPRSIFKILLGQLAGFLILLLLAAALISGVAGDPEDAIVILLIVVLNAVIGAFQEYRAEHAVAALKNMAPQQTRVLRGGALAMVAARELVPGDVVHLEAGNIVPADVRLLDTAKLQIDEAALTGESLAVEKHPFTLDAPDLPLGERPNMAYKGTQITMGRGVGLVVATGMATELGKIAALLNQETTVATPLQQRLAQLGKRLALVISALCAGLFGFGLARGEPALPMFLTAVSLAVAAIPEALPAVVTVTLALGAAKMSRLHALIRHLPAVETLGSVTVIASDKTGTLTENRMRLEALIIGHQRVNAMPQAEADQPFWRLLGEALALNNDATLDNAGAHGDPTEVALLEAAQTAGFAKPALQQVLPRIGELPFDSTRKRMTTLHRTAQGAMAYVKGAPEAVLELCAEQLTPNGIEPLRSADVLAQAHDLASEGYRVLAVAYRHLAEPPPMITADLERDFILLGLVGLIDPPRAEAAAAVADCRTAGVRPIMITGDHPGTALAIARRLGIGAHHGDVVTGRELAGLDPAAFHERVANARVFARVDPEQKIQIVESLQAQGEFVAMTGDGVNDAPALRRADIGVAMGGKGSDVARGGGHGVAGRQLRHHRRGGARRPAHLRQSAQVREIRPDRQHRRNLDAHPCAAAGLAAAAAAKPNPVDQFGHRRFAGPGAGCGSGGTRRHDTPATPA
ncbi:MAG: HAD-IC family P-type ATPase [Gammaproteobacteria bacterium]